MALTLAILATFACIAAVVAAWRARAASHRLALEMVSLRDRLAEAEAGRQSAERRAAKTPSESTTDAELRERIESLEERLRAVREREVTTLAVADEGEDLRATIERRLRREGFERIAFLESPGDGALIVEAERHGLMTKGRAVLRDDGSVRLHSVSNVRAFP